MVTPSASSRFSDMGSYNSWAGASVEFLAAYGITTGTGDGATFSPASTLTRGDYILMLYRTFGFSSTAAAGNFTDVAAGSYYAEALAHAKALASPPPRRTGASAPTTPSPGRTPWCSSYGPCRPSTGLCPTPMTAT